MIDDTKYEAVVENVRLAIDAQENKMYPSIKIDKNEVFSFLSYIHRLTLGMYIIKSQIKKLLLFLILVLVMLIFNF